MTGDVPLETQGPMMEPDVRCVNLCGLSSGTDRTASIRQPAFLTTWCDDLVLEQVSS